MKRALLVGLVLLLAGMVASCVNPGAAPTRSPGAPASPAPTTPAICGNYCNLPTPSSTPAPTEAPAPTTPAICGNYCNLPTPAPTTGAILGGRLLAEVTADGLAASPPDLRAPGRSPAVVDAGVRS